jgi:hypothetical protein
MRLLRLRCADYCSMVISDGSGECELHARRERTKVLEEQQRW